MIFVLGFYPVLDIIHKWFGQLPTKSDVVTLHTASETLSKNTLFATTEMPEIYLTPLCIKWAAPVPNAQPTSAPDATLDYVPFPAKPASIPWTVPWSQWWISTTMSNQWPHPLPAPFLCPKKWKCFRVTPSIDPKLSPKFSVLVPKFSLILPKINYCRPRVCFSMPAPQV